MANNMTLDELFKSINKSNGRDVITHGMPQFDFKRIPFTSPRMNYCTFGGIPQYYITEFFGEEHGGKTTTALDVVANYQRLEGAKKVFYVDVEGTLDVNWANTLGVDTGSLMLWHVEQEPAETIFETINNAIKTGEVGLVVLDSIGAMTSKQAMEKTLEERTYCGISGPLTEFARQVGFSLRKYECTLLAINQIRDDINSPWGGTRTTGGRGWKHLCMCRFEFTKGKYIDSNGAELKRSAESPAGMYVLMSAEKNKSCPPTRRTGFYTLNFKHGIDYLKDLVDVAIKYDFIIQTGAWYSIVDQSTGEQIAKLQGITKVYEYLEDEKNEAVLEMIESGIDEKIS